MSKTSVYCNPKAEGIDIKQLAIGTKIEMEHTNDRSVARRIAIDHLKEIPDYYEWLKAMEKAARSARSHREMIGDITGIKRTNGKRKNRIKY